MADNQPLTGDNLEEIAWALKPAADTGDDCVVNARAVYDAIRAAQAEVDDLKAIVSAQAEAMLPERGDTADPGEVVHMLEAHAGYTSCCGRTLFDLPRTDRVAFNEVFVTCGRA